MASFACWTFGSSNGLTSSMAPATAVAISQRTNSAPNAASVSATFDGHDGRAGGSQGADRAACVSSLLPGDAGGRTADRRRRPRGGPTGFAGDRHDADALLAGAFGDQLLDPEAERLERLWQTQRHLVAAGSRGGADRQAERRPRDCSPRRLIQVPPPPSIAMPQPRIALDVVAHQRRRHESEERQRRVAAADVAPD